MKYRLVEKPAFKVVGKTIQVSTEHGENQRRIPRFWDECLHDGSHAQLVALTRQGSLLGDATLGVCMDFDAETHRFTYMIGAAHEGGAPGGMVEKTVPAAAWAVFEARGSMPEAIQNVWGGIWSEFFKAGEYKHGNGPDVEVYPPGDPTQPDYRSEVWVPVIKA